LTTILPYYTHIVNPRLRHTYLSFDGEGNLLIKSPEVPQMYIEQLLFQKADWIRRSRQKILEKKGRISRIYHEMELYYLGKVYPLQFREHAKKRVELCFGKSGFSLLYKRFDMQQFQKQIYAFYKTAAKKTIPPLVDKWAERMSLYPESIIFRKAKRQWGSCLGENRLSFNTMLMKLPLEVIEYVIVHELAHIRHKHHQKAFWKLVEETLPDYRKQVDILKTYTPV